MSDKPFGYDPDPKFTGNPQAFLPDPELQAVLDELQAYCRQMLVLVQEGKFSHNPKLIDDCLFFSIPADNPDGMPCWFVSRNKEFTVVYEIPEDVTRIEFRLTYYTICLVQPLLNKLRSYFSQSAQSE